MGSRIRAKDLRFCRRIGERGDNPRPIVFGVDWESDRKHLLEKAKELRLTKYDNITIVPDLTKAQRRDEQDLREEADERNKQLTEEDRNRNLKWIVVGRRGEKRLIKGTEREYQPGREERAGMSYTQRPSIGNWLPRTGPPPNLGARSRTAHNLENRFGREPDMHEGQQERTAEVASTNNNHSMRRDSWPPLGEETQGQHMRPTQPQYHPQYQQHQQQYPTAHPAQYQGPVVPQPQSQPQQWRGQPQERRSEDRGEVEPLSHPRTNSKRGRGEEWEEEQQQPPRRPRQLN